MARLPVPGSDDGTWGDILNDFLSQSHNPDGTLQSAAIPNGSVTPAKLSQAYVPASEKGAASGIATLDATGKVPASQLPAAGSTPDATATTKGVIQLAGDLGGTATAPTVPGLAAKADDANVLHLAGSETVTGAKDFTGGVTINGTNIIVGTDSRLTDQRVPTDGSVTDAKVSATANIAQSKIANLSSDLAGKEPAVAAGTTGQYYRGDKSWQTLDKSAVGLTNVDNTSDANKPISTATQAALDAKADETVTVSGATSLTGGGDLTANRTLSLVGDAATPGNSRYYGTDGTGTKGFHALPAGDPTLGGDLTGTASNAQIAAGAVGSSEIANDSVTEPKLDAANSPSNGQVLSWNGTNFTWVTPSSSTGYVQGQGIAKITVGTTAPATPAVGDVWIST